LLPAVPEWPPLPAGVTRRPVWLTELVQPSTFDGARCAVELSAVEQMKAQLDASQLAVVKQLAEAEGPRAGCRRGRSPE
jgi:hypothetical protein